MKVLLKETISSLGIIGSEVNVKNGYARNYLLPQQKAVLSTPQNRRMIEKEKVKFDIQIAKEREAAELMANSLKDVVCKISGKVTDVLGSVLDVGDDIQLSGSLSGCSRMGSNPIAVTYGGPHILVSDMQVS